MPSKCSWYFSLCLPSNDWILVSFHSAESQMSFVHFKALIGLLGVTSLILLTAIVVILIKRRKRGYNTCIWFTSRTQTSQDGNETNSKLMTTELWIVIYSFADILAVFPKISAQQTHLACMFIFSKTVSGAFALFFINYAYTCKYCMRNQMVTSEIRE